MKMILILFFISNFWLDLLNFKNVKLSALQKDMSKESMLVVWHPDRWWDWCLLKSYKVCVGSIQNGSIETSCLLRY